MMYARDESEASDSDGEQLINKDDSSTWTVMEKKLLMKGIEKYGHKNVKKLKEMIPSKTPSQIKSLIYSYNALAISGNSYFNPTLQVWLDEPAFSEENELISTALLFISLFEDLPQSEEAAGFDLRTVYKFLHHTLQGDFQVTPLSSRTTAMLKDLQQSTEKDVWPADKQLLLDYLVGLIGKSTTKKNYKRKKENF